MEFYKDHSHVPPLQATLQELQLFLNVTVAVR